METLKETSQGEIPTLGAWVYDGVGESPEEVERNTQLQIDAAFQAYYKLKFRAYNVRISQIIRSL